MSEFASSKYVNRLSTTVILLFLGLFVTSLALPRNRSLPADASSSRLLSFSNSDLHFDDDNDSAISYDDALQFKGQLDAISKIIESQTQQLFKNFTTNNTHNNGGSNPNLNGETEENNIKHRDHDDADEFKPVPKKTVEPQFFAQNGTLLTRDYKKICGRKFLPPDQNQDRAGRIIGGKNATFAQHPWQISLMIWKRTKFYHSCGAVLLNENWAVTAAHCLKHVRPTDLLLRFGQYDFSESDSNPHSNSNSHPKNRSTHSDFVERRIRIISRHHKFDPEAWNFKYDLALLKFSKPVVFAPNIIPICLPPNDDKLAGKEAVVTGWGRIDPDKNTKYFLSLPSKLQEVSVPVVTNRECNAMYVKAGFIEEKFPDLFICAGLENGGKDACDGDSGGPMSIQGVDNRWFLAGIVSFGIGCGEKLRPGLYTRISIFRHWIEKIIPY